MFWANRPCMANSMSAQSQYGAAAGRSSGVSSFHVLARSSSKNIKMTKTKYGNKAKLKADACEALDKTLGAKWNPQTESAILALWKRVWRLHLLEQIDLHYLAKRLALRKTWAQSF